MSPEQLTIITAAISAGSGLLGALIGSVSTYLITQRQVKANVLATSREKWITELRHGLSEFSSVSTLLAKEYGYWGKDRDKGIDNRERLIYLSDSIRLQLNPRDTDHDRLSSAIQKVLDKLDEGRRTDRPTSVQSELGLVTMAARSVIGAEWEKIKQGK